MNAANLTALLGAMVALCGSYLAYRRGSRADEAKTESRQTTTVVEGFSSLVKGLQSEIDRLGRGLEACQGRESTHLLHALEQDRKIFAQDHLIQVLTNQVAQLGGKTTDG